MPRYRNEPLPKLGFTAVGVGVLMTGSGVATPPPDVVVVVGGRTTGLQTTPLSAASLLLSSRVGSVPVGSTSLASK
jgi:hypothetical protein